MLSRGSVQGAAHIVSLLSGRVRYSVQRIADAYELLGATQLDEFNDVSAALAAWRRATAIRNSMRHYTEKTPVSINATDKLNDGTFKMGLVIRILNIVLGHIIILLISN